MINGEYEVGVLTIRGKGRVLYLPFDLTWLLDLTRVQKLYNF